MLSKKMEEILNKQIQKEGYSANLYLAMATWTEAKGFSGIPQWLYEQAEEEKMHMMKFIAYINDRGGHAIIPEFEKPPVEFGDIHKMFDQVLEHEQYISKSIHDIVDLCLGEKDHATHSWIQWFVTEQIEEESSAQEIIDKLNLIGDKNLYVFDRDIMKLRAGGEE